METIAATADDALARATAALDAGELVVLPLDLQYALVADALDDDAIGRLFLATARGADQAPTVAVGGVEDLHHVAFGGAHARDLSEGHWPGPAVLPLKARPWLPDAVTAGSDQVNVTVPRRAFARDLAKHFGPYALVEVGPTAADALARVRGEAHLLVEEGDLPGGEAKVIRGGTSAAP